MRSPGAGGYFYPTTNEPKATVWTAGVLPSVVALTRLPPELGHPRFKPKSVPLDPVLAREGDDYVIERLGAELRVHLDSSDVDSTAVLLPFDGLFEVRVAAALRLWRALNGRRRVPTQRLFRTRADAGSSSPCAHSMDASTAQPTEKLLQYCSVPKLFRSGIGSPMNCAIARLASCASVMHDERRLSTAASASLSRPFVGGGGAISPGCEIALFRALGGPPSCSSTAVASRRLPTGSRRLPLPANFPDLPPRYLRTPEAARFVGLSIRTLEKHRIYGTGPRYSKLGGRVVYRVEDLQAWVESAPRRRRPTLVPRPCCRRSGKR